MTKTLRGFFILTIFFPLFLGTTYIVKEGDKEVGKVIENDGKDKVEVIQYEGKSAAVKAKEKITGAWPANKPLTLNQQKEKRPATTGEKVTALFQFLVPLFILVGGFVWNRKRKLSHQKPELKPEPVIPPAPPAQFSTENSTGGEPKV